MGALFSDDRVYRYRLTRPGAHVGVPPWLWVMLNPSDAAEERNDPTIRKCGGYQAAHTAGPRGDLDVVNVFALVSTDPAKLRQHPDPIGPDNDVHIDHAAEQIVHAGGRIVVAWGAHPFARERAQEVAEVLRVWGGLWCLGTTKDGSPRHPLYVPYAQPLVLWEGYR